VENELAVRRGFDLFVHAAKANIALLQGSDRVDQVAQRATQTVELPDHQGVARSPLVEDLRQLGSLVEGAARIFGEDPIPASCLTMTIQTPGSHAGEIAEGATTRVWWRLAKASSFVGELRWVEM